MAVTQYNFRYVVNVNFKFYCCYSWS